MDSRDWIHIEKELGEVTPKTNARVGMSSPACPRPLPSDELILKQIAQALEREDFLRSD